MIKSRIRDLDLIVFDCRHFTIKIEQTEKDFFFLSESYQKFKCQKFIKKSVSEWNLVIFAWMSFLVSNRFVLVGKTFPSVFNYSYSNQFTIYYQMFKSTELKLLKVASELIDNLD